MMTEKDFNVFEDDRKEKIHAAALEVLKGSSNSKGKMLKVIIPEIVKKLPESIPDYLIYRTLLESSNSDASAITSGGPWRGYFLDQSEIGVRDETDEPEYEPSIPVGKLRLKEKDLYSLVAYWMKVKKGYDEVNDCVANFRKGSVWSNPDVVAFNIIDRLGFYDVEIVSAEIKLEDRSWRQYIFEAVSHRRYANRSYFIFRSSTGMPRFDPDMYSYAEKFSVGIAIIDLPDDKIEDLQNWSKLLSAAKLEFVDSIIEVVPAPSHVVPTSEKCEMMNNLKITQKDQIHKFGTVSE